MHMTVTERHEIALAASEVLAQSSVAELRKLRVDEDNDNKLRLSGQVRSFYHKQLAQETVRTVAGGMQVINRVAVCSH
jgi:osmotically-inducible protein OsmY